MTPGKFVAFLSMEMCIRLADIVTILKVVERIEKQEMAQINILDIIISFNRMYPLHTGVYDELLTEYHKVEKTKGDMKKLFYFVIDQIRQIVSFEKFNWILVDAGYRDLSNEITTERKGILLKPASKRELPHADTVNEYFSFLKRCVDNNSLQDGTRYRLECFIESLDQKISQCYENSGKLQLLIDKRVMLYFLLAQQFSEMENRLKILKRMRDCMPHDVDRTLFDTVYHSYMIVIWSIKDDPVTAAKHEERARFASHLCLPGLGSIILTLCAQYKNNIFYFRRHNSDDLVHATVNFEEVFQMFDYVKDDPKIYSTIAMLEMVHTLLGIDWDLKVSDITKINPCNIEKARSILSSLEEPPETRRQMLYSLCSARVHERQNPGQAKMLARKSLDLADDGSYYSKEKTHIKNYLDVLSNENILPHPQI